jgi:fatty acid desaturase
MNNQTSSFSKIRQQLVNSESVTYSEFRATCKPKKKAAIFDFIATLSVFISSILIVIFINKSYILALPLSLILAASLQKMSLFFHEAAHHNLCTSSKLINDRVANLFIGIFILDDIKRYRVVHLAHHRNFGAVNDPENTYEEALTVRLIMQLFLGIRVIKVMVGRNQGVVQGNKPKSFIRPLGIMLYGTLFVFIFGVRRDPLAALIVFGAIFSIFPVLAGLRQLLEHRSPPSGTTRVFNESPFWPFLSGVGFQLHLLHHWDPQLHYTLLPQIHSFLMDSQLKNDVDAASSGYVATIKELWGVK